MKRSLLFAALLAGSVLAPQFASADAMSAKDTMAGPSTMMVCRTPKTDEKANAMMSTKEPLMCKSVDMKKMMTGPDMSQMKSATEADKAWRQFLSIQMNSL